MRLPMCTLWLLAMMAMTGCTVVHSSGESAPEPQAADAPAPATEEAGPATASGAPTAGHPESAGSQRTAAEPAASTAAEPAASEADADAPTAKEAIAAMAAIRDEVCKCQDEACVNEVMVKARDIKEPVDLTEDALEEIFAIAMAMEQCAEQAVQGDGDDDR